MKQLTIFLCLLILPILCYSQVFKVEIYGQGQPVLLIPGYSCSGDVWKETVAQLQDRFECHVLTLPGYAGVAPTEGPILEKVKDDIITYVNDLQLKKPILIGHSLGAFMSLWVASEAPDLFGRIIAVDGVPFISAMYDPTATAESMRANPQMNPELVVASFVNQPEEGFIDRVAQAMMYQVEDPARARQIATWQFHGDRRSLGLTFIEMSTTDLRSALPAINSPILVMGSIYGSETTSQMVLQQQYAQAKDKTIKIAQSKHFIMYDQPEWFFAEIEAFLK
jgi:N-formylmaleamate deformylase